MIDYVGLVIRDIVMNVAVSANQAEGNSGDNYLVNLRYKGQQKNRYHNHEHGYEAVLPPHQP
jgi:hypothetical protein